MVPDKAARVLYVQMVAEEHHERKKRTWTKTNACLFIMSLPKSHSSLTSLSVKSCLMHLSTMPRTLIRLLRIQKSCEFDQEDQMLPTAS